MVDVLALLRELRAGLDGVTTGPWCLVLMPTVRTSRSSSQMTKDISGVSPMSSPMQTGGGRPNRTAAHIARCDPSNIAALLDHIEALERRIAALEEGLRPFARADRAIGDEPGPFRFETGTGYRLIEREDLRRAHALTSDTGVSE